MKLSVSINLVSFLFLLSFVTYAQEPDHSAHAAQDDHDNDHDHAVMLLENTTQDSPIDHSDHAGHDMLFDATGMVMNTNSTELPLNCPAISGDVELTVYAGAEYARIYPERTFAYSEHEFYVAPCARVTVNFVNEDQVRHQWMLHGLPRYLYPQGMFHLEAAGGEQVSGTFIVPADDATYLVHCDITQHMEKGMKAQFVVGKGTGDLWSVPGVSQNFKTDSLARNGAWVLVVIGFMLALLITVKILRPGRA